MGEVFAYVGCMQNLKDLKFGAQIRKKTGLFLQILSMEGRGVRLNWALSKPKGPQGTDRRVSVVRTLMRSTA